MKKGWFELDLHNIDDYCGDCYKTWAIRIYSYDDEDAATPDVTLILSPVKGLGNSYCIMEYSITYVGREIMFDEATELVKRLDELSGTKDTVSLTEHLMICREFFNEGKSTANSGTVRR
ncbi:hypothetical protein A8990_13139 [Paenibacillus taihuensis]|uniref:Uncharacterized protein n=1 Tax=Paenibacillus taihuensis TaxID=1156355 RepID=A0A3D9R358_9BACL|nr:hypothetical protein [Paenibacillus taihuensis]REE69720.1 hypothetical protein A8990_13139 [Paenibacillus taihuensis]